MWTDQSNNSTTWSESSRYRTISIGTPIGLLLSLTYAEEHVIDTSTQWLDSSLNTTNWSQSSLNTNNWSDQIANNTIWS